MNFKEKKMKKNKENLLNYNKKDQIWNIKNNKEFN